MVAFFSSVLHFGALEGTLGLVPPNSEVSFARFPPPTLLSVEVFAFPLSTGEVQTPRFGVGGRTSCLLFLGLSTPDSNLYWVPFPEALWEKHLGRILPVWFLCWTPQPLTVSKTPGKLINLSGAVLLFMLSGDNNNT